MALLALPAQMVGLLDQQHLRQRPKVILEAEGALEAVAQVLLLAALQYPALVAALVAAEKQPLLHIARGAQAVRTEHQ